MITAGHCLLILPSSRITLLLSISLIPSFRKGPVFAALPARVVPVPNNHNHGYTIESHHGEQSLADIAQEKG